MQRQRELNKDTLLCKLSVIINVGVYYYTWIRLKGDLDRERLFLKK